MAFARSAFLLLVFAVCSPGLAQTCLSPEQGRALIESGRVRPFPEAARRAGLDQDVMEDVQLCHSTGGYRYEVEVLRQGRRQRTEMPAEIPTAGERPGAGNHPGSNFSRGGNNGHGDDLGRNDGSNPGASNHGDGGSYDGSPGRSGESNGVGNR